MATVAFLLVVLAPSQNRRHAVQNLRKRLTPLNAPTTPCLYKRKRTRERHPSLLPNKPSQFQQPYAEMTTPADQVINDEALQQYTLTLPGVDEPAFLKYVIRDHPTDASATVYDLTHTYVTPAMRGCGVAARLVSFAVDHARQNDHKVIPSCRYIGVYMKRHPQDKDVLLV